MRSPVVLVGSMEPDSVAKEDAAMMAVDTAILGADEPSLLGRLVVLRALSSDLGRHYSEAPSMYDSIYQNRLAYMNREVLRVQAERLSNRHVAAIRLFTPCPIRKAGNCCAASRRSTGENMS